MNYIGSKKSLLGYIANTLDRCNVPARGFACDVFAGTGAVSVMLAARGHVVHANDLQYYSYVLLTAQLTANPINDILNQLNELPGADGQFYREYCVKRTYFSRSNGMKIQAIRDAIENMKDSISHNDYCYLIACLLKAADKVANTASVYAAYLKNIKKSAHSDLVLAPISCIKNNDHRVTCLDATSNTFDIEYEVGYIDPPYNGRQYGSNYHILETIAKWDMDTFVPAGITGLRPYVTSTLCSKRYALESLRFVLCNNFNTAVVSYSNEGILSMNDIIDLLKDKHSQVSYVEIPYKRFMANGKGYPGNTVEYIIVGQK